MQNGSRSGSPILRYSGRTGVAYGLAVLAIAQMEVHLVFFLHITTGSDNTNNVLALAFGISLSFARRRVSLDHDQSERELDAVTGANEFTYAALTGGREAEIGAMSDTLDLRTALPEEIASHHQPRADMVTSIIEHEVKAGRETEYETWLKKIAPIAARFPGHQGVSFVRPSPGSNKYTGFCSNSTL